MTKFEDSFSEEIWKTTYKDYKDETVNDTFMRVAKAIASVEKTEELQKEWTEKFYDMLTDFKITPGGRIYSNAGTDFKGTTLINCFTENNKILTSNGYKNINEIEINDYVLTHTGSWKKVVNTLKREYKGDVFRIKSSYLIDDIVVTPEHPFYHPENKWITTENLDTITFLKFNQNENYVIDIIDFFQDEINNGIVKFDNEFIYSTTNFIGGQGAVGNKDSQKINRFITVNEEFAYFLGRFIGDGGTTKNIKYSEEKLECAALNISFSKKEKESAEYIKNIAENIFNTKFYLYESSNKNLISVSKGSTIASTFIRKLVGRNFATKRVPKCIWVSNNNIKEQFLLGLFDADGTVKGGKLLGMLFISLSNKNLVQDIHAIGLSLGLFFRRTVYNRTLPRKNSYGLRLSRKSSENFRLKMKKVYDDNRLFVKTKRNLSSHERLEEQNGLLYTKNFIKSKEYYDGYVYNISVEDDESYIVNNVIVHNCFVSPNVEYDADSIEGIAEKLLMQMNTLKSEGGFGLNFSFIRPRGAFINGIGVETPGAVKFMELFDKSSDIITAGSGKISKNKKAKKKIRKGAQMAVLNCVAGSTEISTLEGKIQIKDLVGKNPYLYCTDIKGSVFIRQATKIWKVGKKKTVKILFDDDTYLICTPDHRILRSNGEYIEAQQLKFRDSVSAFRGTYLICTPYHKILKSNGECIEAHQLTFNDNELILSNHKVISVEDWGEEDVYDIMMPEFHNFVANGVFVHNCNHPDIIEFITAKQQPGRLTKFNVSVNIFDTFMEQLKYVKQLKDNNESKEKIEEASKWNLIFPDTTFEKYKEEWDGNIQLWEQKNYPVIIYNSVNIEWLWNLIMESTFNRAEPGILFLDRANYYNPLNYKEYISATNPCITGDTMVYIADGRGNVSIKQLAEEGNDIPVFCYNSDNKIVIRTMRNPRITGYNLPIYKITLDDGNVLRTTANHKFKLLDNTYKQVSELSVGDSLKLLIKYKSSIFNGIPKNNHNYFHLKSEGIKSVHEHRLIGGFINGMDNIPEGYVIHHKDHNTLNNSLDNLQLMTNKEHMEYHMIGDNNPMKRAKTEWSQEKWNEYSKNMSNAVSAENNGRAYNVTNDELREHVLKLTKQIGYRISNTDWRKYALENGLPSQFSKWRNDHFGGISGLALWAAQELGFENINIDPRIQKRILKETKEGYNVIVENDNIIYIKSCEICGKEFKTPRKENGICNNVNCLHENRKNIINVPETKEKQKNNLNKTFEKRRENLRNKQSIVYNNLKFNFSREPLKKEWQYECKINNISCEIGRSGSPFKSYNELKEYALNQNHKIISIEFDGYQNVYNGTVDEFHNFFIGGFESIDKETNDKKFLYFNNLNCGEQQLAPSNICCLSTTNLTQFINDTRTDFDYAKIRKYVRYLVRFLDNVNTYSSVPLQEYKDSMVQKRRIGCGIMGWGSSLYIMKIRFASQKAQELQQKLMSMYARECYMASIDLAIEKGMFELCEPLKHIESPFIKNLNLPEEYLEKLRTTGIRNSALLSIQPNGNCVDKDFLINIGDKYISIENLINDISDINILKKGDIIKLENPIKIPTFEGEDYINNIFINGEQEIIGITLENGDILKQTLNHKYLVKMNDDWAEWIDVKDLLPGMKIISMEY